MKHPCVRLIVMALVVGAGVWGPSPSTAAEAGPSGSPDMALVWQGAQYLCAPVDPQSTGAKADPSGTSDVALVWQGAQYLCAPEEEEAGEEVRATTQATGALHPGEGCEILRPVGWNRWGVGCIEGPSWPIFVADGQTYTAFAVPWGIFGSGYTTLRCNGGALTTIAKVCRKTGGGGWVP